MRRMPDGRLRSAGIVGIAVVAVTLASGCGGASQRVAVPVPQTIGAVSRDVPGLTTTRGTATSVGAAKRLHATPNQLVLTRAHGAVFNVTKLKGVVVKKERPEHEDPLGNSDDADASARSGSPAADMPSQLAQKQMVQRSSVHPNTVSPAADISFAGLDFATWGAGHPPDENGDVGPTYYIQTVNTSIGIYDKSNGNRVAAFTFNTFMSQGSFGNLCDNHNFGDPVVLYDSYENRWMISDFAFTLDGAGNVSPQTVYQCFAVSKTSDPVNGGWNFYSILDPGGLADYPKFGIWPDGIYMSANMFGYASGSAYAGYHVWALNKQQMYANAPQVSVVDFFGDTSDFTVTPANSKLAAGAPPVGSPEYFVSTWNFLNTVQIYKFHVDWDKISTSTFTGPFNQLAPNCWPNANVPNASTPANGADTLQIRAMATPQYTNIGGAQSVWVAHTVRRGVSATNTSCNAAITGNATIRWYQANVTGGTVAANVVQGSSFDPEAANTYFRFQPALAVDRSGDMAVTYTKSNATTNPAIMYDGRLAGDPTNTLGTENTLLAGTGAQSGTCGGPSACTRWGDYAGMQLDPNGCAFWMTGEYYAVNGLNDLTRIGSFHYPGCTTVGNGTLSGTVTDGVNPISGATITLGSRTTTTNGSGGYSFTVPAGTYPSLTADSPGFTQGTASSLAVPNAGTLTKNFTLSAATQSGCVTDNSQSLFQRGAPSSTCDLTKNPGSVQLGSLDNTATQNTTVSPTGFGISNTAWGGQTFTPTVSGKLKRVDVELFCSSCTANSPNVTLSIRATTGATPVPTGADLATATLAGFNDGGAGGLKTFTLTTPLQVTAGTRYAFIFRLASSFANGIVAATCSCATTGFSDSSPYANGQFVTSTNSGSTWTADTTAGGRDLNFVTYINPGFSSSATFVSSMRDANPAPGSSAHWTTFSFVDTTPANTAVKFQVAGSNNPYGPWTYVGPDGTGGTFFTTSGASLSQFNGKRYLRYEAFLTSSDPTVTPSISSVTTCFMDVPLPTTLVAASASGTYGGSTTLSATLTSSGNGVPGETVTFKLNGTSVGGATTDVNGVATLANVSLAGISGGSYPTGVAASFAGDSTYKPSSGSNSLSVSKANQSITFATPANRTYGAPDFSPGATASSGLAVSYSASGACSIVGGGNVHLTGAGTCTVSANQAGNTNYNAAPQVQRVFSVAKAALSITAGNRQKYFDQALTLGTAAFTTSGLVGSDSVSKVTLTSAGATATAASGNYAVVPSAAVAGPSTNLAANYTIAYHNGTLQVLPVGIIGLNGVSVATSGGKIDSFNSSAGAYGTANHGSVALVMSNGPLSFAGVALLGSTISTQGTESVAHTANVSGNVTAGTTASILGTVSGTVTQHAPSAALSRPTISPCAKFSGKTGIRGGSFSYSATTGNLAVKGGTVKLASKTYCFNNVTLAAGSTLSVRALVTIHLRGKLTGKGHIANMTKLPAKLRIDTSYTGSAGVAIVGGAHAAMTLVAPKTTVTISGGSYFGTVLGATVSLTGGLQFHADMR